MKRLYLIVTLIFSINIAYAQESEIKEAEIKVNGVCDMCKKRIEKAVDLEEVKYAKWDKRDKILTIAFDSTITADSLQKRIALAGHDNEKYKAPDEAYENLPKCCYYRHNVKTH